MTLVGRSAPARRLSDRLTWRLAEHFFRAMFDFGLLSTAGADSFKRMLLTGAGGFVALGLLLGYLYAGKYAMLRRAPELYQYAVLGDDMLLVGLPMLLTAFVTLLAGNSLFPDERDFRILGPLPVHKSAVFGAKLIALSLFSGLLFLVTHVSLLPLMLLTSINPFGNSAILQRLSVWVITGAVASAFALLAVTSCVGLCMLGFPRRWRHELTGIVRSLLLFLLVLGVPLVLRLSNAGGSLAHGAAWLRFVPPAWFVGLQQVLKKSDDPGFFHLAAIALVALGAAALLVVVTYVILFRHFERLLFRSGVMSPPRSAAQRTPTATRATPAFRAVYRFMLLTLRRSQLHQNVFVGLSACGVGIVMNRLLEANLAGWLAEGGPLPFSLASAAMWTPFGALLLCGLSVRATLVLPMEHRANWIFRLTEDGAFRREQLRAVDQLVTICVVGVSVSVALPVLWLSAGRGAVAGVAVVALIGLVFVHVVLLDWQRIPFTCSYLPGKRSLAHSVVLWSFVYAIFTRAGVELVRAAVSDVRAAVVIVAGLAVGAYLLRRRRLVIWQETPLMFDDQFPDEPVQLGL